MARVRRRKATEAQPTVPSNTISFHQGFVDGTVEGATRTKRQIMEDKVTYG